MTTARNHLTLAPPAAATPAVDDVTCLLPRARRCSTSSAERLPLAQTQPVTLFILGLLRRDDGRPVAQSTVAQVTSLLARSLRGDDWLGSSGPAEFAVVLSGGETAAKTAAERLVRAVAALDVPGLSATAGIAALSAGPDRGRGVPPRDPQPDLGPAGGRAARSSGTASPWPDRPALSRRDARRRRRSARRSRSAPGARAVPRPARRSCPARRRSPGRPASRWSSSSPRRG